MHLLVISCEAPIRRPKHRLLFADSVTCSGRYQLIPDTTIRFISGQNLLNVELKFKVWLYQNRLKSRLLHFK